MEDPQYPLKFAVPCYCRRHWFLHDDGEPIDHSDVIRVDPNRAMEIRAR